MNDRSGSRCAESGVGTAMRIASASATAAGSSVAEIAFDSTSGRSRSDDTSPMWLSPRLIESTTDLTTSTMTTVCPASAKVNRGESHIRSEEHTSELQSHVNLVCRLLLEKK